MPTLTIDTTTIYGAIRSLSVNSPHMIDKWGWSNAMDLMHALVFSENLLIAPVPMLEKTRRQHLAEFIENLRFITGDQQTDPAIAKKALKDARKWSGQNAEKIEKHLRELNKKDSFSKWLEWNVESVWPEHCARLGGITDKSMDYQVAKATGQSIEVISEVNQQACSSEGLKSLQNGKDTKACELARQLYVASIVIRGSYYSYISHGTNRQFFPHLIREKCLPKIESNEVVILPWSLAQKYFVGLLILASYRPKRLMDRFKEFGKIANIARNLRLRTSLLEKDPSAAVDAAVTVAKELKLDFSPRWVSKTMPILEAFIVGCGGIVIGLNPYHSMGLGVGLAATETLVNRKPGDWINSRSRYKDLCELNPGTIRRFPGGYIKKINR